MADGWRYQDLRAVGLTEGQIRWHAEERRLARPYYGVYIEGAPATEDLARLRALFLRLPAGAAVGRQTGARLHGFGDFVPPARGAHIVIPAGTPRPELRGVTVHESALPVEPMLVNGVPCLPAARCAIDLARTSRRLDALPVLDGALRSRACTATELAIEVLRHAGLRGVCQARELLPLADGGAQCRQESQLRLVIVDGGLPRPSVQIKVFDDRGWLRYILDLGWEERRIGVEYDGASHLDRARARHDRERHNWLAAHGWRMRYFTDLDLYRRQPHIVSVLRAALC